VRQEEGDGPEPPGRMPRGPLEVPGGEQAQERHPAPVQRVEKRDGDFDRRRRDVRELRPLPLLVRLDGGLLFRQRELDAHVRVEVAVGDVVRDLPHGPAAWRVWRVELGWLQSRDGLPQPVRRLGENREEFLALRRRQRLRRPDELADGIARIGFGHERPPFFQSVLTSWIWPVWYASWSATPAISRRAVRRLNPGSGLRRRAAGKPATTSRSDRCSEWRSSRSTRHAFFVAAGSFSQFERRIGNGSPVAPVRRSRTRRFQ